MQADTLRPKAMPKTWRGHVRWKYVEKRKIETRMPHSMRYVVCSRRKAPETIPKTSLFGAYAAATAATKTRTIPVPRMNVFPSRAKEAYAPKTRAKISPTRTNFRIPSNTKSVQSTYQNVAAETDGKIAAA